MSETTPARKLSIVVPVYYNAESLAPLYERLGAVERRLEQLGVALELIFVDDGSADDSVGELLRIKERRPETIVVKLTRNFGADPAVKCGFGFITGDCFLVLAADLQDPPELIPELVERWLSGAKFVICARSSRDDALTSRFLSAIYYRLLRWLVMPGYPAGGYDVALFDSCFLPHMRNSAKMAPTLLLAYWLGYKPEVISYRRERRVHGKSRWTLRKKLASFRDVMLGFSVTPLRLMSLVGVVVAGLSFAYGMTIIVYAFAGDRPVPGFPTLVALISFLMSLVIIMLGLIGEYLARILNEINRRPEAVIEKVF